MKISVITPTLDRAAFLPGLYQVFQHQTWADRELVVLDNSAQPNTDFLDLTRDDSRVRYIHEAKKLTPMQRRRIVAEEATGDFVAHFEDCDYYAPKYLETHVANLRDCQLVTLRSAFSFHVPNRFFAYWRPHTFEPNHFQLSGGKPVTTMNPYGKLTMFDNYEAVWGQGYAQMYDRKIALDLGFSAGNLPENFRFFRDFRSHGNGASCYDDTEGLMLHFLHGSEPGIAYPQYRLPNDIMPTLFGADIAPFVQRATGAA